MSLAIRTTIMFAVAVAISLVFWWFQRAPEPSIMGPAGSSNTTTDNRLGVRVNVLEPVVFQDKIFVSGSVIAEDEVYLRSEAAGRIIDLKLQEGTFVRKGTLLAKINDADLQAQLRRTTLNLELAQIRETRQRQLLENRAISQQDYDIMLNEVNTILAEIDLIKANIAKTEVVAPFDGMVGLRNVSEGAFVSVGQQLATLQNLDRIRIDFSVPERYAASVKTKDVIQFTRQGSGEIYTAIISAIEPRIDPNTRTLSIRATASNPGRRILPGAFAQITYSLSEISDALLVPAEAIIPELGQTFVFVLRDGMAHRVPVQTGIRTDTQVQIIEGLVPGDSVLVTGILQLRQGMPVRVTQ